MKVWIYILAAIVAYYVYSNMTSSKKEKFGKDDKDKDIHIGDTTLILYYADWCPHCMRFKPVWNFVKSRMETDNIHFKDVDCTEIDHEVKTPQGTSVPGYPSMYLYRNGREHYYEGGRNTEDVLKWIRSIA